MNRIPIMNVLIMNDLSSNNMNKDTHDIDARGNGARGGNSAAAETGRDTDGRGVVSAVAAREGADDAGSGEALREAVGGEYKYGFVSDIDTDIIPQGLNADIVRLISQKKGEPDWRRRQRVCANVYDEKERNDRYYEEDPGSDYRRNGTGICRCRILIFRR